MRKGIKKFSSLGGHQFLFKTVIEIFKVIDKGPFGNTSAITFYENYFEKVLHTSVKYF